MQVLASLALADCVGCIHMCTHFVVTGVCPCMGRWDFGGNESGPEPGDVVV